jgi:hypothetical protein
MAQFLPDRYACGMNAMVQKTIWVMFRQFDYQRLKRATAWVIILYFTTLSVYEYRAKIVTNLFNHDPRVMLWRYFIISQGVIPIVQLLFSLLRRDYVE